MTQPMKHQRVGPASPLDQGTWQQILTAAKDLFFAKGYKGVSMKEIADAVQVMPSALYYHFPKGKEDLVTKSIQGSPQVSQLVTVLLDGIASPEHQHQHERFSEIIE